MDLSNEDAPVPADPPLLPSIAPDLLALRRRSHHLAPLHPRQFRLSHNLDAIAAVLQELSSKLPLTKHWSNPSSNPIRHIATRIPPRTHLLPSHSPSLDFGSKSPYPEPIPLQPLHIQPVSTSTSTTRLIHVSLIARHGTRNPTSSCLQRMTALQNWLLSAFSPTPQWLHDWSAQLNIYRASPGSLTSHGQQELHAIGSRFARLYARSLHDVGNTVRLRSSYKDRAIASARAFLDGYRHTCSTNGFPQPNTLVVAENSPPPSSNASESSSVAESDPSDLSSSDLEADAQLPTNDSNSDLSTDDDTLLEILPSGSDAVLRYFERNQEYAQFAVQHKALTERHLSRGPLRPIATEIAARVSKGLGASHQMDPDLIRSVAEAGAFENAHGRFERSKFCRVLTPNDTAILELFEKYHRPFYQQHERFRAVAAPLVADLAQSLRASAARAGDPDVHAADLRFAHAETLVPLLFLLGIESNGLSRKSPNYRTGLSAMSPFAANLSFELYEQQTASNTTHFVRLRLHERYVECIPALGEHGASGIVPLQHLLDYFDEIFEEGMHFYQ
ncbi:Multiple inositol polyphosphate phosphatase 1 [Gracilariopsis chorda]|uniref:Multiple inositol polyphosphate phosphatase 1 n=1 Tax=Gracilariopsis chorda TaxID=448386 RepID=A0A2V3IZN3_9FLOR|nr:Multiple inositol polyphosphate phosphatase 1 [Gracilariopsis chorda]|eukprot:PXF47535.1 Multiple inositol polyphosphate phosphatase 1 [Gracilariopsis chorda]